MIFYVSFNKKCPTYYIEDSGILTHKYSKFVQSDIYQATSAFDDFKFSSER